MPAAIGEEAAAAIGSHGGPSMDTTPPLEFEQSVIPGEMPLKLFQPIGEPDRLN